MNNTFFQNAKFTGSYPTSEDLPLDEGTEIAFCGRSNCGKSSILNALTNNKKLAKTSKTPGRTQAINFFDIDSTGVFKIVDLPGYGYAKVSKKMRSEWGKEIEKYLMTRKSLNALCIFMDIRHPFKEDDLNTPLSLVSDLFFITTPARDSIILRMSSALAPSPSSLAT